MLIRFSINTWAMKRRGYLQQGRTSVNYSSHRSQTKKTKDVCLIKIEFRGEGSNLFTPNTGVRPVHYARFYGQDQDA